MLLPLYIIFLKNKKRLFLLVPTVRSAGQCQTSDGQEVRALGLVRSVGGVGEEEDHLGCIGAEEEEEEEDHLGCVGAEEEEDKEFCVGPEWEVEGQVEVGGLSLHVLEEESFCEFHLKSN